MPDEKHPIRNGIIIGMGVAFILYPTLNLLVWLAEWGEREQHRRAEGRMGIVFRMTS